jgi:hypothetical protein
MVTRTDRDGGQRTGSDGDGAPKATRTPGDGDDAPRRCTGSGEDLPPVASRQPTGGDGGQCTDGDGAPTAGNNGRVQVSGE